MKKIYLLLISLVCISCAYCCDICGCSSGNYFIGPYPFFHNHFFGVRYTYRSFHTTLTGDPSQFSKDFYQTIELWGGWRIGKKWQVFAFVPYNINHQNSDDGLKNNSGLGDISLILNYNLFTKKSANNIRQELWIGGGLKLPTGKFNANAADLIASANSQAGTGSMDFLVDATYALHIHKLGFSSNLTYKINEAANGYKFGNRLSSNTFGSYSLASRKVTYSPNLGILYEKLNANILNKEAIASTGGYSVQGSMGIDIMIKKVVFGANIQLPISENISDGQTHTLVKGMAHVTFLL